MPKTCEPGVNLILQNAQASVSKIEEISMQACKCAGIYGNFAQSWEEKKRLIQSA